MTNRVKINKTEQQFSVVIKAFKDEAKQKMLLLWITLFTFCGVAIFTQFFGDYDNATKVFFGVYVAFWLFFEFKVVYAYRWRKYGVEKLIIENNELILIKEIGKRGITQCYPINEIKNLRLFKNEDTDFVKSMTSSYWNINKYTLAFDYKELPIPFGIDLDLKTAKKLLKELQPVIK